MIDKEELYQAALRDRDKRVRAEIARLRASIAQTEASKLHDEARRLEQECMYQPEVSKLVYDGIPLTHTIEIGGDNAEAKAVLKELESMLLRDLNDVKIRIQIDGKTIRDRIRKLSSPTPHDAMDELVSEKAGLIENEDFDIWSSEPQALEVRKALEEDIKVDEELTEATLSWASTTE